MTDPSPSHDPARIAARLLAADVAIGRDRMLFHRFDLAMQQFCGETPFEDADIAGWAALLERRAEFCSARGIHPVTLLLPERHVVYADALPDNMTLSEDRPFNRLRATLTPEAAKAVLYPLEALIAGKAARRVFYRTDQHLTDDGAYLVYRALVAHIQQALRQMPVEQEGLLRRESRLVGDLGIRLADEPDETVTYVRIAGGGGARKISSVKIDDRRADVYENDDTTLPRAVWFGDSHSFALLPFVTRHFSRLVAVQTLRFMTDLVEREQPDFVIQQFSELRIGWPKEEGQEGPPCLPIDGAAGVDVLYGTPIVPPTRPTLRIDFGAGGNSDQYCAEGWGTPEDTQRWSMGRQCCLRIPAPSREGAALTLTMDVEPLLIPLVLSSQRLELRINGVAVHAVALSHPQVVKVLVPTHGSVADAIWAASGNTWEITCLHPDARSPAVGGVGDARVLGLAFRGFSLSG